MFKHFPKIVILIAVCFMAYLSYELFWHDSAVAWKNFSKPKMASFTALEQEEEILEKLNQVKFDGSKALEPMALGKPNIFQTIEE